MLQILERSYRQTVSEVEEEFPNSKYIMKITDENTLFGFLQAVSTSEDSYTDLVDYCEDMLEPGDYYIGGEYAEGDSYSIQSFSVK